MAPLGGQLPDRAVTNAPPKSRTKKNEGGATKTTQGVPQGRASSFASSKTLDQYGLGSARFAGRRTRSSSGGSNSAARRVPKTANTRKRYRAAPGKRHPLDRWLRTNKTYARDNPKWVYYLSIEFLIRPLARQQCHQRHARSHSRAELAATAASGGRSCTRSPTRVWQRRPRPPRGLLPSLMAT